METSALTPTASTDGSRTSTRTSRSGISSDYNTFLRMLTTQMKNQDPLNPIDSADYAVQLATFSSVEQQTKTNQLIEQMLGAFDILGMSELAGWVGREARAAAPVAFAGTPVTLVPEPDKRADHAVLAVRDAKGVVVAREDVVLTADSHIWNGESATGETLPHGRYTFRLESYAGETLLSEKPVEAFARIQEVRNGPRGTRIILAGGVEIGASEVTALRTGQ